MPSSSSVCASNNSNNNNSSGGADESGGGHDASEDLSAAYARRLLANLDLLRHQQGNLCDVELVPGSWEETSSDAGVGRSAQQTSLQASPPSGQSGAESEPEARTRKCPLSLNLVVCMYFSIPTQHALTAHHVFLVSTNVTPLFFQIRAHQNPLRLPLRARSWLTAACWRPPLPTSAPCSRPTWPRPPEPG